MSRCPFVRRHADSGDAWHALITLQSLQTILIARRLVRKMPTESTYPPIDVPKVDLWDFLFERSDRPFPDRKGNTSLALY